MTDSLRIVYLEAENVKRLKAIRLKPDRTLVRIEGRNAQGKSSVLDAIAAALGGGKWNPEVPVRQGEKRANVKLDLGELKVERRWTAAGGTTLEITSADGVKLATPQAVLDKLVGDLTFDPLDFVRMKAADQADVLRKLAGLDFSALDRERERLFAERTVANRDAKTAAAQIGNPPPANVPAKPIDVAEVAAKNAAAVANNSAMDCLAATIGGMQSQVDGIKRQRDGECHRLRDLIACLESDLVAAKEGLSKTVEAGDKEIADAAAKAEAERAKLAAMKRIDTTNLAAEIQNAETVNRMIREAEAWKQRAEAARTKQKAADELDDKIKAIDDDKEKKLRAAKFPLDGLSIDVNGPTLNGVPFSQASSAEQLRTSVAIGLAQKSRARIMLCRDGSLLDNGNLEALRKIAEEFDAQVFVERVADQKSPAAVYIEDGEIVEGAE